MCLLVSFWYLNRLKSRAPLFSHVKCLHGYHCKCMWTCVNRFRCECEFNTHHRLTHHVYRTAGQVSLCDQSILVGDVQAFLGQGLDDGVVSQ